jgi:NADPH:quinone reductase
MEAPANRTAKRYSRYGSTTHEQVYIHGGLDGGPTELVRNFGMAWAAEIKTTFASHYNKEVSLAQALRLEEIAIYGKKATGQKYLINPNKGLAH